MGKWNGKTCRLSSMLSLTFTFFLVELIVGYTTDSLALVADSFHMLSDVVALIVGLISVRYSKRGSSKNNTFGWARAEVLGAMVNAVFLVALCFTICVEAIERIVEPESIKQPVLLLVVGFIGLVVNAIGLLLFHNQTDDVEAEFNDSDNEITIGPVAQKDGSVKNVVYKKDPKQASAAQLNMRGVFLHVLGDALGSVVVIISAGIYLGVNGMTGNDEINIQPNATDSNTESSWVNYVDPSLSLILVGIILSTSIPLLKDSGMILMQTVPTHIVVSKMQTELEQIEGVLAVHEFHVWNLAGDKIVASLHLHLRSLEDYVRISNEVKEYFHEEGIHSVTIQPEFLDLHIKKDGRDCVLECGPEKDCHPNTCCEEKKKPLPNSTAVTPVCTVAAADPTTTVSYSSKPKPMDNRPVQSSVVNIDPNCDTSILVKKNSSS